jgi:hypothetical protein
MAECNPSTVVLNGRAFMGLSSGQAKIAQLTLLRTWLLALDPAADVSINGILQRGRAYMGLSQGQFRMQMVQLLCNIAGGS